MEQLTTCLRAVGTWMTTYTLKLNANKTEGMIVGRKRNLQGVKVTKAQCHNAYSYETELCNSGMEENV